MSLRLTLNLLALTLMMTLGGGCTPGGGSASDPPGDASVLIDIDRLAIRPGFTHLDFNVAQIDVFYDTVPPAPRRHGSCVFPNAVIPSTNVAAVGLDLTATGRIPIGGFFSHPGHVTEIRLLIDQIHVTRDGKVLPAEGQLECEFPESHGKQDAGGKEDGGEREHDDEELAILRLVPVPGANVDLAADQTIEVKVDFDPNKDIVVEKEEDNQGEDQSRRATEQDHEDDEDHRCDTATKERGGDDDREGQEDDRAHDECESENEGEAEELELAGVYDLEVVPRSDQLLIPGLVLVAFDPSASRADRDAVASSVGGRVLWDTPTSTWVHVFGDEFAAIQALQADSHVHAAYPEFRVLLSAPCAPPNDLPMDSWYTKADRIDAEDAWCVETGNRPATIIAVIDTGFDFLITGTNLPHPDLVNNIFLNEGELPPSFTTPDAMNHKPADFDGDGVISFHDFNPEDPAQQAAAKMFLDAHGVTDRNGNGLIDYFDVIQPDNGIVDGIDNDHNGDQATGLFVDDIVGWDFSAITDVGGNLNGFPGDKDIHDDAADFPAKGHGRRVSGIAAAVGNNGRDFPGIAWQARILPIRVADSSGGSHGTQPILEALAYAQKMGAIVANVSMSSTWAKKNADTGGCTLLQRATSDSTLENTIRNEQTLWDMKGLAIPVVAALTDCGLDMDSGNFHTFPATIGRPNVISVTATGRTDKIHDEDGRGAPMPRGANSVDIGAPGEEVFVLGENGSSGPSDLAGFPATSYAAPFVTGAIALTVTRKPALAGNGAALRDLIVSSGDKTGIATRGGRLNVFKAVSAP